MISWDEVCRLAKALNGLPVLRCRPGSPAALAGVRYGDVLLSVDGHPTPDWASYVEARREPKPEMVVEVFREGRTLTLRMELPPRDGDVDPQAVLAEILAAGGIPERPPTERPPPQS
jgi:S1-C subfamily serine protease